MTIVQAIGAVIAVVIVVFLILEVIVAQTIAKLLFTPKGKNCPTTDDVKNRKTTEVGVEREIYADADFDAYERWECEKFELDNQGIKIPAVYHPLENARGCVIIAHGFGQNHYAMVPYAELFRKLGFSMILFDERRFGESKAPYGSFGVYEATDVAALVKWAKNKCGVNTKIVLHGVSMGAVSVMNALQYTEDVDYVIEDCGFIRIKQGLQFLYRGMIHIPNPFLISIVKRKAYKLGFDIMTDNPIEVIASTQVPVCAVHGDQDTGVSVECAKELGRVMKNPKSRVEIYKGKEHAYSISDKARYEKMLEEFLMEV